MEEDPMANAAHTENIESLERLYEVVASRNLAPLWTMKGALTPEPATTMVPFIWHYPEVKDLITQAGGLISAQDAERRVLAFRNPGTGPGDVARATDLLWAAVQLVLPGEVAPPHRHTAAALRFIIEGEGAYTTVDGHRYWMEPGDVVLTPNWSWHEHGNPGATPMLWLDGLDLPMIHSMRLVFAEFSGAPEGPPSEGRPSDAGDALLPAWPEAPASKPLVYKLSAVDAVLDRLRDEPGSPYDDLLVEYRDPTANGPILPTMSAYMQLLRPGVETRAHRHSSSAVYHVARGTGRTVIGDTVLDWEPGDTFALPTWAVHQHANPTGEDALLFSFSDAPSLAALGLLRTSDEI
jgi:gentisate 1,2-dioxygenase